MSIIQTLIANADDQCRYLTPMDYYLRLVTYGVAAGETTPIEAIGVIGVRQMYNSLGTPMVAVSESIRAMKTIAIALLSAEGAGEVGGYFDYLIQRVSEKS
jgi:allophycocyanin alpha subunit